MSKTLDLHRLKYKTFPVPQCKMRLHYGFNLRNNKPMVFFCPGESPESTEGVPEAALPSHISHHHREPLLIDPEVHSITLPKQYAF